MPFSILLVETASEPRYYGLFRQPVCCASRALLSWSWLTRLDSRSFWVILSLTATILHGGRQKYSTANVVSGEKTVNLRNFRKTYATYPPAFGRRISFVCQAVENRLV